MKYDFCKVDDKYIEGWLGDAIEKSVLFVMKEPNDKNVKNFFFYDALYGKIDDWDDKVKAKRTATRMINVFGSIARKIIRQDIGENFCCNDCNKNVDVLKKCAFINLSPFEGDSKVSKKYKEVVAALKNMDYDTCKYYPINKDSSNEEIAANRLSIMKNIECKYIVIIDDIFNNYFQGKGERIKGLEKPFKDANDYFQAIKLNNKKIYSFCHHSNRKINYSELASIDL